MKKGFTLVEMLGIIVVLSILVLITYVGINSMRKDTSEKEFEDYKKTVYMASETYIEMENIEVNGEYYIEINDLLSKSYIENIVKNPKTQKKEYDAKVKVTKDQAGVLIFEYIGE